MIIRRTLLGLPALLLLAQAQTEDGQLHNRQEQPQSQPWAVRKMSLDPSEKFFPEQYFAFVAEAEVAGDSSSSSSDDSVGSTPLSGLFLPGRRRLPALAADTSQEGHWPLAVREAPPSPPPPSPPPPSGNESLADAAFFQTYLPPFSVHHRLAESEAAHAIDTDDAAAAATWHRVRRAARDVLDRLQRRQWGCPSGTASCSSIGYPYSCCGADETCYLVTDTGLGPVGCCPSGSTCGGSISDCGSGSTACDASLGGGCCIAGYVCQGVGCVVSASTATTTSTSVPEPSTATVTVIVTGGAGSITTRTTTITTTPSPSTTIVTSTAVAGSSGVAPVKPTLTATTPSTTTASSATLTGTASSCPAGYYGCLATAGGGCCQTGRDCKTTGCAAAAASTTVVDAGGVTVVVPAADATATAVETCANGWFLCGADAGSVAGCCPSGYACGTASCTLASASSTGTVQKELPSAASSGGSGGRFATLKATSCCLAAAGWLGWLLL